MPYKLEWSELGWVLVGPRFQSKPQRDSEQIDELAHVLKRLIDLGDFARGRIRANFARWMSFH